MNDYPYGNSEELNLDWIIDIIKQLEGRVDDLDERVTELEGG